MKILGLVVPRKSIPRSSIKKRSGQSLYFNQFSIAVLTISELFILRFFYLEYLHCVNCVYEEHLMRIFRVESSLINATDVLQTWQIVPYMLRTIYMLQCTQHVK